MKMASFLPATATFVWMLAVTVSYLAYNGTYYLAKFQEFLPLVRRVLSP